MSCSNYRNVDSYDYYTPAEWRYNSQMEMTAADKQQELAQRLIQEADRLVDQAKDSVVKNKQEIDHQSKVKVKDIEFKCSEIDKQIGDLDEEIALLLGYQTRIENANKSLTGDSLDVIIECLRLRNCREGIDLVYDDVEADLLRERSLIYSTNEQLEDLLDQVVLQIRKLRAFVYNLTVDMRYKQNTLRIEAHNEQLNENSNEISVLNDRSVFRPAKISAAEWDRYTTDIIAEANRVLVEGRPIRAFFDNSLSKMIEDLVAQSNAVDQAFRRRVEEYQEVIDKLDQQKIETGKNIEDVRATIGKLKTAIDDKEAYIALVHTRLLNRTRREGVELCHDELETKLCAEVAELEENVRCLQGMLDESVACHRHLKQSAVRVDIQLTVKHNSMRIDGQLCAEQRKRVDYRAY